MVGCVQAVIFVENLMSQLSGSNMHKLLPIAQPGVVAHTCNPATWRLRLTDSLRLGCPVRLCNMLIGRLHQGRHRHGGQRGTYDYQVG